MSQKKTKKSRTLSPVKYNAGDKLWYQHQMKMLIREMCRDVKGKVLVTLEASPMAMDANPVQALRGLMVSLSLKWVKRFKDMSTPTAEEFTDKTQSSVDRSLEASVRKQDMTINMQWTPAMTERREAIIAENVSLIRSIPDKYFSQIESSVFRSIAKGGDRKQLADEIEQQFGKQFGITRRRAELISRDQTRKATSALSSARQQAAGITEGEWVHSGGGNKPRHNHVKAGRERRVFRLDKGCLIDGEYIMPGELINCGCTWKPRIPF
jgi:uncharacterized protein with gpF-like domain